MTKKKSQQPLITFVLIFCWSISWRWNSWSIEFFVFINVFKIKCKLQISNPLWQKFEKTFILNWVKTETELKFFLVLKKTRWQVTNENHFSVDDIRDLFLNFFCLTNFPFRLYLTLRLFHFLTLHCWKSASEKNKR
jgi:hypothetical protein